MWFKRYFLFVFIGMFSSIISAQTVIKVGGYEFPPFVNTKIKNGSSGATLDLIDALNLVQDKYRFEFFPTSSKRRYLDFSAGRYDLILFESIDWGWTGHPVEASDTFMEGGEVYIAFKREGRDQTFFKGIANKRMVGILGYHYGFANFNADEEFLTENFNILLSTDHLRNIRLILANRPELAEIAVVTRSYLGEYLHKYPEDGKKLLISETFDQEYKHRILIRKNATISTLEINQLLKILDDDGVLRKLRMRYGIESIEVPLTAPAAESNTL